MQFYSKGNFGGFCISYIEALFCFVSCSPWSKVTSNFSSINFCNTSLLNTSSPHNIDFNAVPSLSAIVSMISFNSAKPISGCSLIHCMLLQISNINFSTNTLSGSSFHKPDFSWSNALLIFSWYHSASSLLIQPSVLLICFLSSSTTSLTSCGFCDLSSVLLDFFVTGSSELGIECSTLAFSISFASFGVLLVVVVVLLDSSLVFVVFVIS